MACVITNMKTDNVKEPVLVDHPSPAFSWAMRSSQCCQKQTAFCLKVAKDAAFHDVVFEYAETSDRSTGVNYAGKPLEASSGYYWQVFVTDQEGGVTPSPVAAFETGLHGDWGGAGWIQVNCEIGGGKGGLATFRREFDTRGKKLRSAKLYSSALGVYDVYIDNQRVGHLTGGGSVVYDELKPGAADNDKRVYYLANDVTQLLEGACQHAVSVCVSSGWWNGIVAYEKRKKTNAFLAQFILTYQDGTKERIVTDSTWKTAYCGPVMNADIFTGETYDANASLRYRCAGFDDSGWLHAQPCKEFTGEISAFPGAPVRVRDDLERSVKSITVYDGVTGKTEAQFGKIMITGFYEGSRPIHLRRGETVIYDMGQNFSGVDELVVSGSKNTAVTLRHGEMLNDENGLITRGNDGPQGSLYTRSLREAKAAAVYILCGAEKETYRPTHTYFGYRYVEVTATADITIHSIVGKVLTSVETDTGFISTSDEKVNRLFQNIRWGQYSNYLSIPTDCPQRAERQGWSGDTQVFSVTAAYNADVKVFLEKWMQDMRDSQAENGAYPNTAPANYSGGGVFGWADAGVIVPYHLYLMYGDRKTVEDSYTANQKFMDEFMLATDKNGGAHAFGDWLAYQETDMNLLSVAYYAWDAQMMGYMAAVLGRQDDVKKYGGVYEAEKDYFIRRYIDGDGALKNATQTACLYALKVGLFPDEKSKRTISRQLLDQIETNGNKLQTGFLGTAVLLQTLSEIGAQDVAYTLFLQNELPSWLYSLEQGATTVWERWDAYTKEYGFGDPNRDDASFNHYSFGAVGEWMYRFMAGIEFDRKSPGFKRFILQPAVCERLSFVDAKYDSIYGTIQSGWRLSGSTLSYSCVVPANTDATLYLPWNNGARLLTNGSDLFTESVPGACLKEIGAGKAVIELSSGHYRFTVSSEHPSQV